MELLDPRVGERKRGRQRFCGPWMAGLPKRERPDDSTSQITSPLNGPVNFLKSLNADVCELAKRAESSLRAMQNEDVKGLEDDVR